MKYEQPKLASLLMRTEMACIVGSSATTPTVLCSAGGNIGQGNCNTYGAGALGCADGNAVVSLSCLAGVGDGVACGSGNIADGFAPGAKG